MCAFFGGGSSKFLGGVFSTGIRSTFGRYASYWNAFLFSMILSAFGKSTKFVNHCMDRFSMSDV